MLKRLLCFLGAHGPEWFGSGAGVSSSRNYSLAPGHRRCLRCGTAWIAYEATTNRPYRVLAWERIPPKTDVENAAALLSASVRGAEERREGAIDIDVVKRALLLLKGAQ